MVFFAGCCGSKEKEGMTEIRFDVWSQKMAKKKLTVAPELKTLPPIIAAFSAHVHRAHVQAWRCQLIHQ